MSSTVILLHYHQSSLDFSAKAFAKRMFFPFSLSLLIQLKMVVQKNAKLQLDQLPELTSWLYKCYCLHRRRRRL